MNNPNRSRHSLSLPDYPPQTVDFSQQNLSLSNNSDNLSSPSVLATQHSSQNHWANQLHRTSNSRDEIHPSVIHTQNLPQLLPRLDDQQQQVKREPVSSLPPQGYSHQHILPSTKSEINHGTAMEDSMPSTSDFVKKLYKMLEDQSFQDVVSWGPQGDCFVVKDMNEFTKSILPRMFKHSNFASFVRQLNKYDFHKVKNTDDNSFGEHSWTFRHPDFHADRRDALENIKRKVPSSRKSLSANNQGSASTTRPMGNGAGGPGSGNGSPGPYYSGAGGSGYDSYQVSALQQQVDRLTASHEELSSHIRSLERNIGGLERNLSGLERNYHEVLIEMVGFQRNMAQQDGVMQGLIEWVLRGEGKGKRPAIGPPSQQPQQTNLLTNSPDAFASSSQAQAGPSSQPITLPQPLSSGSMISSPMSLSSENPFVPTSVAQRIIGPSYRPFPDSNNDSVGRAALMKMNEISRRAGEALNGGGGGGGGFGSGCVQDANGERPPSRLWTAATNAGLINPDGTFVQQPPIGSGASAAATAAATTAAGGNLGMQAATGPVKITSRQDALAKIEELQRMRPASAGFLSNAAARLVNAMETFGSMSTGGGTGGQGASGSGSVNNDIGSAPSSADGMREMSESSEEEMVLPSQPPDLSMQQQASQSPEAQMSTSSTSTDPWNVSLPTVPPLTPSLSLGGMGYSDEQSAMKSEQQAALGSLSNPFPDYSTNHEGLQVYTVGHLMPKSAIDDMSGQWSFDAGMMNGSFGGGFDTGSQSSVVGGQETRADGTSSSMPDMSFNNASSSSAPSTSDPSSSTVVRSNAGSQKLRVRRSTFVPGWAVSPRVLLVDDDAVSRKLSSKFLQVFGCKIDVAVDGVGAVNKMNLEKYDLVLMDIVMPKLDGVSATSLIRKFDHMTPIISMTSNSKPNEIMTYYSSGMNDILPKPFTKQGLLDMLEKHLMHLKVIQQMARVPRSVGIPPLSDSRFEEAITSQAALISNNNATSSNAIVPSSNSNTLTLPPPPDGSFNSSMSLGGGDAEDNLGRLNPLAGMGLTDEQYSMILTGLVNGESFSGSMSMGAGNLEMSYDESSSGREKRPLEDGEGGRDVKRSRFEVIE